MDEMELVLADFDEGQMSELLEDIEYKKDAELSERIKARVIPAVCTEEEKHGKIHFLSARRIFMIAASFVAVISAAVAVMMYNEPADVSPVTTESITVTTTDNSVQNNNPLMLAISNSNETLIDILLENTVLLTKDVLSFAIECADSISYESVQKIASATLETLGTTGLDGLLESTLLGDSVRALEELKKRENMLMTPLEKLAFFFSVAFCDSEVVEEFLKRGYDIDTKSSDGKTAYEIALEYGNEENAVYISEFAEK